MTRPNISVSRDPNDPSQILIHGAEVLPVEVVAVLGKKIDELFFRTPMTRRALYAVEVLIDQTLTDLINMRLLFQGIGGDWLFDYERFQKNEESDVEVPVVGYSEC